MTKTFPSKLQIWIEARKRHKLGDMHIQMARELGLNPKKFGKLDNHKQERWKAPLPQFIERIYFKHFKKDRPDTIKSIEQMHAEQLKKKQNKALRKAEKRLNQNTPLPLEAKHGRNDYLEELVSYKTEVKIPFASSMFEAEDTIAKAMNDAKKKFIEEARKKQTEKSNEQQNEMTKI